MMKRLIIISGIMLCLLIIAGVRSDYLWAVAPADFTGIRPSGLGEGNARSIGMGQAYVALSNDASGVFWNPAGLAQIRAGVRYGELMVKANKRNEVTYDTLAFTSQVFREHQETEFSLKNYVDSSFRTPVVDRQLNYNYGLGFIFSDSYGGEDLTSFFFSMGKRMNNHPQLMLGTKFRITNYDKYINERNEVTSFVENSLGVGALYEVNNYFKVGLTIDNLIKSSKYSLPVMVSIGTTVEIADGTILALDGYNLVDEKTVLGNTEFRAGLEKSFLDDNMLFRVGTKNGNLNLGFGIEVTPGVRFNYAFMADYDTDVQQHFIDTQIKF